MNCCYNNIIFFHNRCTMNSISSRSVDYFIFYIEISTKFNTVLQLATIYRHRLSCLKHFENFEQGMGEGHEEKKAQLRLELAKLVFSDPATGIVKQTDVPELNINGMVQKAVK